MLENNVTLDEGVSTSVWSVCSHARLVVEGKEISQRMTKDYNVKLGLAHYSCFVDLLGRAGHLDEAYFIIKTMEVVDIYALIVVLMITYLHLMILLYVQI
ncbi:hypothetical protein CFOL_v3_16667 [Cephalotus follicularis]|uniref:PPR domain-containing protein n=1 Tax=Cephalotus follicularis TaxID=3775 RepID=A0A1Q3BYU8_CEPFO|nr:hypothetical protein CFOL_v3_16667 [Cephalotus follicularis]